MSILPVGVSKFYDGLSSSYLMFNAKYNAVRKLRGLWVTVTPQRAKSNTSKLQVLGRNTSPKTYVEGQSSPCPQGSFSVCRVLRA